MNEVLRNVFNRASLKYSTFGPEYFSYFGGRLVEVVGIDEGENVLDVAAGRGASLFTAVDQVGINGSVIGVDFSSGMVNEVNNEIAQRELMNVKMIQMSAEELEFADHSFDHVICGLAIQFFSDHKKALHEMYRVLNNGGTLGISTWAKKEGPGVLGAVLPKYLQRNTNPNNSPVARPNRPDWGTKEGLQEIMRDIGFKKVDTIIEEKRFYYRDEEEWWNEQWSNASRGAFERIEKMGEDVLQSCKEDLFAELQNYKDDNGIFFDGRVIYTICDK